MNYVYIESLVREAKIGNKNAQEKLFEEFKPMILKLSQKTYIDGYDFYDINHECYIALLKAIKLYDVSKHRFVAYATNAIKNNIKYLIRKSNSKGRSEIKDIFIETEILEQITQEHVPNLEDKVCDHLLMENIEEYINDVDPKYREILHYTLIKNETIKDYSKRKQVNYSTSVHMKKRGISELRNIMLS